MPRPLRVPDAEKVLKEAKPVESKKSGAKPKAPEKVRRSIDGRPPVGNGYFRTEAPATLKTLPLGRNAINPKTGTVFPIYEKIRDNLMERGVLNQDEQVQLQRWFIFEAMEASDSPTIEAIYQMLAQILWDYGLISEMAHVMHENTMRYHIKVTPYLNASFATRQRTLKVNIFETAREQMEKLVRSGYYPAIAQIIKQDPLFQSQSAFLGIPLTDEGMRMLDMLNISVQQMSQILESQLKMMVQQVEEALSAGEEEIDPLNLLADALEGDDMALLGNGMDADHDQEPQ